MDYSVEPKISSIREQASKAFSGKARSPLGNQSQKFQDTQRVDIKFGQPYIGRNHELKQNADDVPGVQQKHTGKHHKQASGSDIKKDDELVKHMSNLPGYLQQMERGVNFQGKVLNFGVLDWKRLEKWKNNEELVPARRYKTASSSESNPSFLAGGSSTVSSAALQSKIYASQRKYPPSNGLRSNSAHEERLRVRSQGKVTKPRGFEIAPWSNVDGKRNLHMKDRTSGEKFSEIYLDKGKKKESDNRTKSVKELSSSDRRKNALRTSLHVTKSGQDFETDTTLDEEIDLPCQPFEHESIVVLLPKSSPNKRGSTSIQLSKSRTLFDENSGEAHSNPGCISPEEELHYLELCSEIPHSCPLPRSLATNIESNVEQCTLVSSLDEKLQFDASGLHQRPKEVPTIPSYSKRLEVNSSRLHPSAETPQRLDQYISTKPFTPGKHVSCSSNARMARNPIFKEGPSVPQSDSSYFTVKSGPVGSGTSAGIDAFSRDNIIASNRATSRISTTTDTPRILDQDISEQPAIIGRHPSPTRRFTFSKMTRSLSFKEGTTLPPLSSSSTKVKSGPLSSEAFHGLDKFDRHNVNAGNSALLSPSTKTETPRRLDRDLAEHPGMIPSPGRFSFSRMTRNFSFKEGPSVPRLSSSCAAKSRPEGSEAPDGLYKLNRDNLGVSTSARFSPSTTAETPRRLDQNIAEQPDTVERHPSPSRRFSFRNRHKISRSLDFKEVFSVPQLSSYATVKSRLAGLNSSAGLDKFDQDNVSASNRARSSPLRRLLDPLLKPRGVVNSTETVKPSNENLASVSLKPLSASELLQNQRHVTPNVQALLQLTRRNGLPLFKLVVENGSDILAAAVKQLPTPGDDASSLIYALYSVHEIKNKNGGWMSQGSRGKRSSFGYNIIGQMKVFNSCPPGYSGESVKDQYASRESVLYSVEIEQGNKEIPEFKPSKELAAIAIKNSYQKDNVGEKGNNGDLYSHEGFTEQFLKNTCNGRENEDSNSTTAILGGVHGLPDKVIPSPSLVWRYGGSCDCGGWDVGCKLQIFTTQDQKRNSKPSSSCSTGLDLFFEGGHHEKKPSFSLAPFKTGVYSVEFNSSISLLQSFFISIAFLSSQKLHEIFEGMLDAKNFNEPKIDKMMFPTTIQGNIPARYVTKPPPSPVSRV